MVDLDSPSRSNETPLKQRETFQQTEEPVKIYKFRERLETILARSTVKTSLGKQIKIQMASHARLTDLREKMKHISDENKKLSLFEEYQKDEYTRHLIIVKQHARPIRAIKTPSEMLKCVSSANKMVPQEESKDSSDDESTDNLI